MTRYAKAIIAFFTSLGAWGATAGLDGVYDQVELWGLTGPLVVTLGVYFFPNTPPSGKLPDPSISEQHADTDGLI